MASQITLQNTRVMTTEFTILQVLTDGTYKHNYDKLSNTLLIEICRPSESHNSNTIGIIYIFHTIDTPRKEPNGK